MRTYIIRRVLLMIPSIIIVSVIVFFTVRLIPGDILDIMVAQQQTAGEVTIDRDDLAEMLGLDVPVHEQYFRWVGNIITKGDWGYSLWRGYPILDTLLTRFPVSFEIGTIALFVSMLIAFPIGIYSAIRQDTIGDYLARSFSIACIAIPGFWIGTMVVVFPSIWWNWSPPVQYIPFTENPLENLKIVVIPAAIMGMNMSGITMRMTRTMMLEVLRQDYIRTAWSKGLTERFVVLRHAVKNAFIPVITIIGIQMPLFLGGSVVMEQIFALPGIGLLTIEVLNTRDYLVLSGINLFMVVIVLLINLGVDLTYAYLDPRVRFQ